VLPCGGDVVAPCPGGHPEQVACQRCEFVVRQRLRGVALTGRGVDCCRGLPLGERRGGQHAQETDVGARISLEAECRRRPGSELGKVPVEKPGPVQIGDEPSRRR
jgi:hypothetical protein